MTHSAPPSQDAARLRRVSRDRLEGNGHRGGPAPISDEDRQAREAVGRVRWFSQEKGYGFIEPDDGTDDVFVRHSVIDGDGFRALEADQRVRFRWTIDDRGPHATAVHAIR